MPTDKFPRLCFSCYDSIRFDSRTCSSCLYRVSMTIKTFFLSNRCTNTEWSKSRYTELTYLLILWCRVLLEKLTGLQASQETPRISRNPKVHYRTHKRLSPVSILGQPNTVLIPTSHLLEIHPYIIHPSKPRSPQWSPSLRFPHQDPIHPPLLTHTRGIQKLLYYILYTYFWPTLYMFHRYS